MTAKRSRERDCRPTLWFDSEAEEAANFYIGIFPDSKITNISRYGKAGYEIHHRPADSVMAAASVITAPG